jgi:hypothetical protein
MLRRHHLYGDARRGKVLREGGIAEASHHVTSPMQADGDGRERRPVAATGRGREHQYPHRRFMRRRQGPSASW